MPLILCPVCLRINKERSRNRQIERQDLYAWPLPCLRSTSGKCAFASCPDRQMRHEQDDLPRDPRHGIDAATSARCRAEIRQVAVLSGAIAGPTLAGFTGEGT